MKTTVTENSYKAEPHWKDQRDFTLFHISMDPEDRRVWDFPLVIGEDPETDAHDDIKAIVYEYFPGPEKFKLRFDYHNNLIHVAFRSYENDVTPTKKHMARVVETLEEYVDERFQIAELTLTDDDLKGIAEIGGPEQ